MDHDVLAASADRFWQRIEKGADCWEWVGAVTQNGYGRFSLRASGSLVRILAHRYPLLLAGVEVPVGMDVDHLCRNRRCVRPDHLEVVDHRTNVLRGVSQAATNAVKTHCDDGHEFTPANTYGRPDRPGRQCRACQKRRDAAYRARRRAVAHA